MAEETKPMTRRERITKRLKEKYPDREYEDDEALFGQISDDYDEYDNELNGYKERESKLIDVFNKDKRNAQFFTDMARGDDPWINVIKRLGIDGITDLLNDPSKQEAYAEANKEYVERLARENELEEEYKSNLQNSLELLEKIQKEQKLSDDQIDAAYDLINQITNDAVLGKITEQTIDMALKAVNHDLDVQNANKEGMIAGKNVKAEEKLRKPKKGDGTPNLQGSNNPPSNNQKYKKTIFDWAQEALE